MFWLYILIGVLVVVVVGGFFIVCYLFVVDVDADFPRDKNGNIKFDKINDYI